MNVKWEHYIGKVPDHCIVAETIGGYGIVCGQPASARCSDFWANELGPYAGDCAGVSEDDGNFMADPLLCDPEGGDFGLRENSPCLPGNHGGYDCGLIGAGAAHCGIIPTLKAHWGKIKAIWR